MAKLLGVFLFVVLVALAHAAPTQDEEDHVHIDEIFSALKFIRTAQSTSDPKKVKEARAELSKVLDRYFDETDWYEPAPTTAKPELSRFLKFFKTVPKKEPSVMDLLIKTPPQK